MLWIVYWFWPNFQGLIPIRIRSKCTILREYAWGSTFIVATLSWNMAICPLNRYSHGRTPRESFFFENPKLLGLDWQIGPKNERAFWAFLAQLQYPSWHSESLVHGFDYLCVFLQLWISSLKHINAIAIIRPSSMIVIKMMPKYLLFFIVFMWKSCHLISNSGTGSGIFSSLAICIHTTIRGHSITTWTKFCTFSATYLPLRIHYLPWKWTQMDIFGPPTNLILST
jgi:hypothetical protein